MPISLILVCIITMVHLWDKMLFMLILMEAFMVAIYMTIMMNNEINNTFWIVTLFLSLMVMEGGMGLIILTSIINSYGSDFFFSEFSF